MRRIEKSKVWGHEIFQTENPIVLFLFPAITGTDTPMPVSLKPAGKENDMINQVIHAVFNYDIIIDYDTKEVEVAHACPPPPPPPVVVL